MNEEILKEARKQIGLLLRNLRNERKIGTKALSLLTRMSETQILDIELNRRNYTIYNFLKYIQALDLYFFLSEKEGHHLDIKHMTAKMNENDPKL